MLGMLLWCVNVMVWVPITRRDFIGQADESYLIGPPSASQSYLRQDRILDVAQRSGAQVRCVLVHTHRLVLLCLLALHQNVLVVPCVLLSFHQLIVARVCLARVDV